MPANTPLMAIVVAALVMNTACTTTRSIELDEQTSYADRIQVGDKVRLLFLDERVREIRVTEVNGEEITGKLETGGVVIAEWADIHEVEQVQISALKTAGAAVGIAVAIPVLALLALASGCMGTYC